MFTIIGLIALLGAVTVGVAGIQANSGEGHTVTNGFTVFDHTYTGSSGLLFAYGILVGAIGTCGLIMLLAGLWTTSRRGVLARRELRQSKREMVAARRELSKPPPAAKKPAAPAAEPSGSKAVWSVNRFLHKPGSKPPAQPISK
ncbi:hypothetical protein [Nocardia sp. NPDC127526]|uniref:hypothetical protein n=1 Tax=Nocardia sp. NPDC127526 TaxID=3345393 RepID=UPI0036384E28